MLRQRQYTGLRAAGGVIVIVTKSGKKGKTSLDVGYYYGTLKIANLPTMLNGNRSIWIKWKRVGIIPVIVEPILITDKSRTDLANTDWLKELFVPGHSKIFSCAASGGSDKIST